MTVNLIYSNKLTKKCNANVLHPQNLAVQKLQRVLVSIVAVVVLVLSHAIFVRCNIILLNHYNKLTM